jgi:hypothetical protein
MVNAPGFQTFSDATVHFAPNFGRHCLSVGKQCLPKFGFG